MGLVPTPKSIIGQYINGRNAQDDFLQLANNHGGTVFGWIDADGHLQGSLLFGLGGVTSFNSLTGAIVLAAGTGISLTPVGNTITINSTIFSGVQSANSIFAGPTSGPAASPTFRALVVADMPTGYPWSSLGNAVADLILANAGFNTTFNQTSATTWTWANITAATSGLNQSSPILTLAGTHWNGAASVSSGFTVQSVNGAGVNNGANLIFSYFGDGINSGSTTFPGPITGSSFSGATGTFSSQQFSGAVFPLTAAANAVGSTTAYTGTFTGVIPQPGMSVVIAGFVNGANNGTFVVFSSNATTLVVYNSAGVSETHAATSTTSSPYFPGTGNLYVGSSTGGTISIQGVNNLVGARIEVPGPNAVGLVIAEQGNPIDVGFLAAYSKADKSHGFEIGAIYDGTGANPGFLNWGRNAAGGHILSLTMPDGITGISATGTLFTSSSVGTVALQASTGSGTASLTISGTTGNSTFTGGVIATIINATTGFQVAGAATTGNVLRGNGTNFVSSAIQAADLPAGTTKTIASGTAVLGTSAIPSGTAATVVTVSATGVLTTDTIMADFNADPTATTGYAPSASGMLTIIKYPTANNVNFKVVNNTGASITPGAVTLNFRVVR